MVSLIVGFSVVTLRALGQKLQSPRMIKDLLFNETHYSEAAGLNTLLLSQPWDPYHLLSPRICEDLKVPSFSQFSSEPHIKL